MKNENHARRGNIRKCTNTGAAHDGRHRPFFRLPVFVNPRLMFPSARDDTRDSHAECAASAASSWGNSRHLSHATHEKFTVRKKGRVTKDPVEYVREESS